MCVSSSVSRSWSSVLRPGWPPGALSGYCWCRPTAGQSPSGREEQNTANQQTARRPVGAFCKPKFKQTKTSNHKDYFFLFFYLPIHILLTSCYTKCLSSAFFCSIQELYKRDEIVIITTDAASSKKLQFSWQSFVVASTRRRNKFGLWRAACRYEFSAHRRLKVAH